MDTIEKQKESVKIKFTEDQNQFLNEFFHSIGSLMQIQMMSEKHHTFVMETIEKFDKSGYVTIKENEDKRGGAIVINFDVLANKYKDAKKELDTIKKDLDTLMSFNPFEGTIKKNGIVLPTNDIMKPGRAPASQSGSGIILP